VGVVIPAAGFVVLCAALGAGLGLMFAPSSGRRLRQDVGERFDVLRDRIKREARKHALDARRAIG
jgi:gas vesicle protein